MGKLSYVEYINLFSITIILGLLGGLLALATGGFILFFISVIPGVFIDALKFAAKVFKKYQQNNR